MFLNDLLQYSRRNMDENEAYNRGLKGQKRGYLYDIMTNPNYGFTNATRQGAGANLGFDVEMPQNPQERMFVVDPEVMRRNGSWLTDENTGLPTNMVPGSILSKIFQPKSAMSEAVQNFDTTMGRQDVRADYMREASQHMGMLGQALGFGSGEPYNTNTWDAVNTGNPNTIYTGGHGTNSLASYANTRSQKQVPRSTGGAGEIDPLSAKSTLLVQGTNNAPDTNYDLPNGIKQLKDHADRKQKELDALKAQGTRKEPDPNNPGKYIEYYLDGQTVDEVYQQQNALDAFYNGIATQPAGSGYYVIPDTVYNVLFGGKGYIGPKKPDPNAGKIQTLPNYSAVPGTGNFLGMGQHDSTAMVNNGMGYAKIKKGKDGKWYKEDANGVWHEVTQASLANDYPDWIIQ